MEREISWVSHFISNVAWDIEEHSIDIVDEVDEDDGINNAEDAVVSLDLLLPDDLQERILSYLPIPSIFRAGCVCKKWNEIVSSRRFIWNMSQELPQKPWYFMFTSTDEPIGYAYDPVLRKWYAIDIPCIRTSSWSIASSCGLVSFMDNDSRTELYVCNPLTRLFRRIKDPPGFKYTDYCALAISVNRISNSYRITIVKSKQVPENVFQWDLCVHVYESVNTEWATPLTDVLTGWRGGDESVICDGVLYFLVYTIGGGLGRENRHGLISYNMSNRSPRRGVLMRSFVPSPCSLTCGRLMNMNEKLIMVGGIGKVDRVGVIKGIGIWVLKGGKDWFEIARMPHKFFQGFGEFHDVFACSGTDNLIYIQSYGSPALLVFDVNQKQWKWSHKCPVSKRFTLQMFTGFCFEPRLGIAP